MHPSNYHNESVSRNPLAIIDKARNHLKACRDLKVEFENQVVEIDHEHAQLFIDCFQYATEDPAKSLGGYFEDGSHLYIFAVGYLGFASGVMARGLKELARDIVRESILETDSRQSFWDGPFMSFFLAHSSTSGAQDARFYARAVQEYFIKNGILPEEFRAPTEIR